MGWFDQYEFFGDASPAEKIDDMIARDAALDDLISSTSVTGITDRNKIINPSDILSKYTFGNSVGERRKYNEYLNALTTLQSQQQFSYDEWFESPEQQVIREKSAGLNSDILGLGGSESPSSDLSLPSPNEGLPTLGDIVNNSISSISSVVSSLSSVASLATAFTDIPLKQQNLNNAELVGEQLDLQNENLLGVSMANDIANLLGTAQQVHLKSKSTEPFDLEGWFANDANFAPLAAVYGNSPRYDAQLNKQRNAVLEHVRSASAAQKDIASNIYDTGEIISSPYYSPDQKLTMIQLKPFTAACAAADKAEVTLRNTIADIKNKFSSGLNVQTAIDAANNENHYKAEFFDEANGQLVAAYEQFLRDVSIPAYELERSINQGYLDLFNSDPSGLNGWKAAYLYGSNGGTSWKDAYFVRMDESFGALIDSELSIAKASGDFAEIQYMLQALQTISQSMTSRGKNNPLYFDGRLLTIVNKYENILMQSLENLE